jgi:hypothetical protein
LSYAIVAAKRLFGTPDFKYHALADGIKAIFRRAGKGTLHLCGKISKKMRKRMANVKN